MLIVCLISILSFPADKLQLSWVAFSLDECSLSSLPWTRGSHVVLFWSICCRWKSPWCFWERFHFPIQREHNLTCAWHNPFPSFSSLNMDLMSGVKATICDRSNKQREISRELKICQPKPCQPTKPTPAGTHIQVSFCVRKMPPNIYFYCFKLTLSEGLPLFSGESIFNRVTYHHFFFFYLNPGIILIFVKTQEGKVLLFWVFFRWDLNWGLIIKSNILILKIINNDNTTNNEL